MRWRKNRRSSNIEDRRNQRASRVPSFRSGGSGMMRLLPMAFRFLGVKGTIVAAVGLLAFNFFSGSGLNPSIALQDGGNAASVQQSPKEQQQAAFVSVILADTEDTWKKIFQQKGQTYSEPKLVLFRNAVQSACGLTQSATGPFYCPGDQKVYIDLGFYEDLKTQFHAPGDFAQAYVIAHEVGHHVQNMFGISSKVHQAQRKLSKKEGNKLSVKLELQADCFAGVWAFHANRSRHLLEKGDLEEGLTAANAIGDDTLQKQARGYVTPDSFTHGSAAQRVKWFKTGFESGNIDRCNTFSRT